jgi:hypothetical protein
MQRRFVRRRIQFRPTLWCGKELERPQNTGLFIQQWLPGVAGQGNSLQKSTTPFVDDGLGLAFHLADIEGRAKFLGPDFKDHE